MKRALCIGSALLAGCAASEPAPIAYGGGGASAAPAPSAAPIERAAPRPHQPAPAPNWADGPGTPLSAYALRPEQAQPYDPANLPRTHRLTADETLYDVASAYQIPLRALIEQNRLEPPYAVRPGQVLNLPPPRVPRVAAGESFEDVARAYNVDLRSLGLLNRMRPPYEVRAGDQIVLPALARAWTAGAPAGMASTSGTMPAGAQAAQGRFAWPVRGQIVSRFGAQGSGARLDGIEIAASEGAPILAADAGEVVYAGADLPAYGTLVLIRHEGGYVTAYAYARGALVREGARVRRGQQIAEVGPAARGRPRMLFQVRRGREALDPAPLLGAP